MKYSQFKAEVANLLKTYDQQGLLDDISIRNWTEEALKEFGGNLMEEHQTSLIIERGRARLPKGFWALKAAVKCEQEGYVKEDTNKDIQSVRSYLEWTDIKDYYNYLAGRPCEEDSDARYITETLWFESPKEKYTFYYNQPTQLKLIPHVYKVRCDNDCPNLVSESKYTISIDEKHNNITTNFNQGFIWIWYKRLPLDEDGELMIPETHKNKLKNYILYFVIVRTLESLLLSEDDPNVINKLQYFSRLKDEYFYSAKSESINEGLLGWDSKIKNNNRRNMMKYESLTPRL